MLFDVGGGFFYALIAHVKATGLGQRGIGLSDDGAWLLTADSGKPLFYEPFTEPVNGVRNESRHDCSFGLVLEWVIYQIMGCNNWLKDFATWEYLRRIEPA